MKYLVISTLPADNKTAVEIESQLIDHGFEAERIETADKKISHCIGCNDCWIKTPGICCIKDDYEEILIKMLQADTVVFVAETKLGFISSKAKNLFDRILPMATMHLKFRDGQMRHYSRYGMAPKMAICYQGEANSDFLNRWLSRAALNLHAVSLGAFGLLEKEALYHALGCN